LNNNDLSDSIPSAIGTNAKLEELWLNSNRLSGSIPSSIGNLANLHNLNLSSNNLSGTIPSSFSNLILLNDWIFGYFNLSNNNFTFDAMEFIAQQFPNAIYGYQKNIPVHQNGKSLSVSAGGTLSNNTYKLLKWESGTTYTLVGTNHADSVFHPAVSGIYQVKILNSVATGLVLYSKIIDYTAPANAVIAAAPSELQQSNKPTLLVYPNPAKDILHIQSSGKATFSLIDESGKTLLTKTVDDKAEMNVSNLPAGLYYLKNNSTQEVQKIIISR